MAQEGLIVIPQVTSAELKLIHDMSLDAERLSGSHALACCSDTSSGPVPTISADAVNNFTVVPVTNLSSVSLAAAAAVAAEKQQADITVQQQYQPEALRNRRRLLLTQAPPECSEDVLMAWISQFGAVEELHMYGVNGAVLGSNCGLVTMVTSEAAAAVVAAVLGNIQLPPIFQKLSVSWVVQPDEHNNSMSSDGHAMPSSLAANADRTIFFAKVPPTALASDVEALFGRFGKLAEVNLFRAWAGAKHSKGCGLITYKNRNSAAAAVQALHGEHIFPGSDCPMVVEWMDLKKQRPAAIVPALDKPPMGCACDAFKLMLSNIPVGISEATLLSTLNIFGPVVQLVLTQDAAGPCASGQLWLATKQAADGLLNRSKAEPVWLRDPRTGHDLALSVKKTRRAGYSNGCSTTTSRISVGLGGFHSNAALSSASNTSSSYLPVLQCQLAGMQSMAAQHSQDLHSNSARLAAAAAGFNSNGSLDPMSMLPGNVMRLLPLQQPSAGLLGPAATVMLQGNGGSTYMAHDVCEAMLDYCDNVGLNMGMPVHLQPAMAAQMATRLCSTVSGLQARPVANSQVCVLPGTMVGNTSGQHCMSSPANIAGLDEFEGSFNMPSLRNNSGSMISNARLSAAMPSSIPASQQLMAQQMQQQQQMQQHQQQQLQLQQQQLRQQQAAPNGNAGGLKSIVVPINAFEVSLIAEHLSFFANQSGAQVTITSLPGTGLAVMVSGHQDQVALAQSLLASARGQ